MSKCNLYLENYSNFYSPGQTVIGHVECIFETEKKVKGIHIRLKGLASVRWTESESHYNSTTKKTEHRSVTYWAEEEYFTAQINLIQVFGESQTIPAGTYNYPFQYILPPQLPSSIEGTNYKIRYNIKATVDRPWKFDFEAESDYILYAPIDLNLFPQLRDPIAVEDDKTVGCCCWKSGPIEMKVSLGQTGFAVGQPFIILCYIVNMSNENVDQVRFKIERTIEYTSHSPHHKTRRETMSVLKYEQAGVGAHADNNLEVELTIPQNIDVPNLFGCNIIKARYDLTVVAVLPFPHTNLDVTIPLQLGHIAINQIPMNIPVGQETAYAQNYQPVASTLPDMPDFVVIEQQPVAPMGMPMPAVPAFGPPPVNNPMSMPAPYPPSYVPPPNNYPSNFPTAPAPYTMGGPSAPVMENSAPPPSYESAIGFVAEKKPL